MPDLQVDALKAAEASRKKEVLREAERERQRELLKKQKADRIKHALQVKVQPLIRRTPRHFVISSREAMRFIIFMYRQGPRDSVVSALKPQLQHLAA